MRKNTFLLLAAILFVGSLSAQSKWKYEMGLGGTLNSGNVNNLGFNANGNIDRNDSILAFNAHARFLYSEENHTATNRGLDGGVKFDINQYDRWSPFFATEFISNHFKGYDFKVSLLAGVKYRIYTIPGRCDYSISAALVGDYVNYYFENEEADTLNTYAARISLRGKIKQRIGENTNLNHTTFYQPNIFDFSDYIVTSITKIENKLNQHLFFDVIFEYDYRSVVPEARKNHDITTSVALRIKF